MVFYVFKDRKVSGAVIFDNSELGVLYANVILSKSNSDLIRAAFEQNFDFSGYDEDLYNRLCILSRASIRIVVAREAIDCDYDDNKGITATLQLEGKPAQLVITPVEISQEGIGLHTLERFAHIDEKFREKITATAQVQQAR